MSLKQSLLSAQWREYKRVSVEGADGPVELVIRRPPDTRVVALLEGAQKEGLLNAATEPTSPAAGLRFRARVVATVVFLPNDVTPLFTEAEVLEWPAVSEVEAHCMAALVPPGAQIERLKGK